MSTKRLEDWEDVDKFISRLIEDSQLDKLSTEERFERIKLLDGFQSLPEKWRDHMLKLTESGQGYHIVNVYLTDGDVYRDLLVLNGRYINNPVLDMSDIKDIERSVTVEDIGFRMKGKEK